MHGVLSLDKQPFRPRCTRWLQHPPWCREAQQQSYRSAQKFIEGKPAALYHSNNYGENSRFPDLTDAQNLLTSRQIVISEY